MSWIAMKYNRVVASGINRYTKELLNLNFDELLQNVWLLFEDTKGSDEIKLV